MPQTSNKYIIYRISLMMILFFSAVISVSGMDSVEGGARMENAAQMRTSYRLLKLGESIEFTLSAPDGAAASKSLYIYPRYLEAAKPGKSFTPRGDLKWVEKMPKETLPVAMKDGHAKVKYQPKVTGSFLAKWTAGGETFYRYFSVIDNDYMVFSFSPFCPLEPNPTLHATGIPLDYRIPAEKFKPGDPLFDRFLGYNREFGDNVMPMLPDTPTMGAKERLELYGGMISQVRAVMPDANDTRSAWLETNHKLDPGYIETLSALGINDHCGLWCANATPWLGMPEFPYFSSPIDARKMNQTKTGSVVSHQWDFCGGWHFMGPVSWHYKVSEGDWSLAEKTMLLGADEFANLAKMSGHPAFVNPLYEALDVGIGYPNPDFEVGNGEPRNFKGMVEDPFVCARALSAEEIQTTMKNGISSITDPLAAWQFDDKGARDLTSTGNNGSLMNGAQTAKGRSGNAVLLDGVDDYVMMDTEVVVTSADFSMGCWVKPDAKQRQWANIMSSHNAGGGPPFRGISFEQESDIHNRFRLITGNGSGWYTSDSVQLQPDVWQHLVVTRKGRTITIYVDGVPEVVNQLDADTPFPPATDRFRIGDWVRGSADVGRLKGFNTFIDKYQRFIAFELPKKYKLVFARSVDVADYYRRHFLTTPRTLFVSKTKDVMYDIWWTYQWDEGRYWLVTRERLPWLTRVSKVPRIGFKDPLSYEFILVEDSRWSIRFERESPNPIWRFDYREQVKGAEGSSVDRTETPDVHIPRARWVRSGDKLALNLKMNTDVSFKDYAIAVWGLPKEFDPSKPVTSNAKECIVVKNTDGEYHLVLFFDLKPDLRITVKAGMKE
ncbi:MAG: LamG domain-containing protein [Armatimonadota bacterium]